MEWDATLSAELVERIWRDPNRFLAEGTKLQVKPRCSVARVEVDGESFVWKRHRWGDFGRTLRKSFAQSVAKKCAMDGLFLSDAGLPTPRPRLYLERRIGPVNTRSYLLTEYVAGTSLYRFMRYQRPAKPIVVRLARQAAAIWQLLDDLRIQHNDFQTENFLVDPQGKLWLIDMERLRRCRRKDEVRRRQIRDIEDLLHPRNWRANPQAGDVFRREILQTPAAIEALAASDGATHPLRRSVPASNRTSQLLSVVIPCFNSAGTLLRCLESVRDMADEILVADAGSTDETLSLVRRFGGCRIIQRQVNDAAAFETWACSQARHDWILRVLPNETVNAELGREVQYLLAGEPRADAFWLSLATYFRGHALNYGGNRRQDSLRLFQKGAAHFETIGGQVEAVPGSDRVGRLRFPLLYELCTNVRLHIGDIIRQAENAAEGAHARGQRARLRAALWRAPWTLYKSYVLRRGFLDGWAGLHKCMLSAMAIYLREALLWDKQQFAAPSATKNGEELRVFPASAEPARPNESIDSVDEPLGDFEQRRVRPAA
jgi:hypothetical protein